MCRYKELKGFAISGTGTDGICVIHILRSVLRFILLCAQSEGKNKRDETEMDL